MAQAMKRATKNTQKPLKIVFHTKITRQNLCLEPTPSTSASTSASSSPASQKKSTTGRVEEKAKSLFFPIEHYLHATNYMAARAATHETFNKQHKVPDSVRPLFYRFCVEKFLHAGDWEGANGLYNRMKAEAMPGRSLVLSMLLKYTLKRTFDPEATDRIIRDSPNLEKVTEIEIQAALRHLVHSRVNVYVLEKFLTNYQEKMGPEWQPSHLTCALMLQAHAQAGRDQDARTWFYRARAAVKRLPLEGMKMPAREAMKKKAHQDIYTRLVIGSATFNSDRIDFFQKIHRRMEYENVKPTLLIANTFIQYFSVDGRADAAYAIYHKMKNSKKPIIPNNRTFQYLFNARTSKVEAFNVTRKGGGSRGLFRDMTQLHLTNSNHRPKSRQGIITVEVLNAALRHFVRKCDYAAATVTLRTFPICKIPPNHFTRSGIIHNLVARIKQELLNRPNNDKILWADRMLGEVIRLVDGIWRGGIAEKLLALVQIDPKAWSSTGFVQIRPLLALLRRALIANFYILPGEKPKRDDKLVSAAMKRANLEMLPLKNRDTVHAGYHTPRLA